MWVKNTALSLCTSVSVLDEMELLGWSPSSLRSVDVDDLRPTPTRSLAMRDHDSRRLCVSQQAAGPRPPFMSTRRFVGFRNVCVLCSMMKCALCVFVCRFTAPTNA